MARDQYCTCSHFIDTPRVVRLDYNRYIKF